MNNEYLIYSEKDYGFKYSNGYVCAGAWLYASYLGRKLNQTAVEEFGNKRSLKEQYDIQVSKTCRYRTGAAGLNEELEVCRFRCQDNDPWSKRVHLFYDRENRINDIEYVIISSYGNDYETRSVTIGRRAKEMDVQWFLKAMDLITMPRSDAGVNRLAENVAKGYCASNGWTVTSRAEEREFDAVSPDGERRLLTFDQVIHYSDIAYTYLEAFYSKRFWIINAHRGLLAYDRDPMLALFEKFDVSFVDALPLRIEEAAGRISSALRHEDSGASRKYVPYIGEIKRLLGLTKRLDV